MDMAEPVVDARTEEQDKRVAEVTRIIFNFLNEALAEHPYYGRERSKNKEGGKKQRSGQPYKWDR